MKKIRIVYVIGQLAYGGAESLLLDVCRKLDKSIFEVSVLAVQGRGALDAKFAAAGIPVKIMQKRFVGDLALIKKIQKYLLTVKPDIVHTHLFAADFYGGLAALRAKVPVLIATRHDILSVGKIRDWLLRRIHKQFDCVIAISNAAREYLIKKEKMSFEQVELIYNGIDAAKFYVPEPRLFDNETITIGAVGRLSPEKGHKHLIRACRFIKRPAWRLIIVGDGPMRAELEQSVKMLALEDRVAFAGQTEEVRPYLEKFDIFVLPSISEGLSLAVIEAACAGRFIIAANVGGVPEIIKHQDTGLLFKPKNIEQLVNQLQWTFDHQDQAKSMARKLQQQVVERFDINQIINQYQELYQKQILNKLTKNKYAKKHGDKIPT